MHVLFLDHQGVMYTRTHPAPGHLDNFDAPAVGALNEILVKHPDMQIVVSSDWKLWVDLPTMQEFYLGQGILRAPIDYTPHLEQLFKTAALRRAAEITTWVGANRPEKWIAIDDMLLDLPIGNFIKIDPVVGLVGLSETRAGSLPGCRVT